AAQAENHAGHVRGDRRIFQPNGGVVSYGFGLIIEGLVAILLMITIGYCMILNKRLKRLKADERALTATIAELITATEMAERAVAAAARSLADRLRERMGALAE